MPTRFEEIKVGDKSEFERRITADDIDLFAKITGDFNSLHMDDAFALRARFGGRVAHGMLTASFISRIVGMSLPGSGALYLSQHCEFLAPVKIGDILKVVVSVERKHESVNVLSLKTEIFNQEAKQVLIGSAKVMVMPDVSKNTHAEQESKIKAKFLDKAPRELREGDNKMSLKNKIALVTGSGRGIGAEISRLFASSGAWVVINYVNDSESADRVADDINKDGYGRAIAVKTDVSDSQEVKRMFERISKEFGEVDILVNNASRPLDNKGFVSTQWSDFDRHITTLIKGAYNCCLEAIGGMKAKGGGKIINILSSIIYKPQKSMVSYMTGKFGLLGMSRSMALELSAFNITVNSVSPGMTDTELIAHIPDNIKKALGARLPLKRVAAPSDIAKVVEFLASSYSDYMTGVDIPVCGGEHIT